MAFGPGEVSHPAAHPCTKDRAMNTLASDRVRHDLGAAMADRAGGSGIRANRPPLPGVALRIFAPFAAGYFLSYLFRTIDGTLADELVRSLALDARMLGLITAVYFLTFAAFQLPLGVLIDRFGPRRLGAALLGVAAVGAAMFGLGHDVAVLLAGRALIGLGTSGALMTGLKALVQWNDRARLPLLNGCFIMFGGLGAMAATEPVHLAVAVIDWHVLFLGLAGATLLSAIAIFTLVPEREAAAAAPGLRDLAGGFAQVYRNPGFRRVAPLSAAMIGTAFAVQSLWAARWMADVEEFTPGQVIGHMFLMGSALTAGAALIGIVAGALRRRGVPAPRILAGAGLLFVVLQVLVVSRAPVPTYLLWPAFAVFAAMTALSYAILAEMFPQELVGRANGALNVMHLGMAFAIQFAMGLIVGRWAPDPAGRYPVAAYQAAFLLPLILCALGLAWFLLGAREVTAAVPCQERQG